MNTPASTTPPAPEPKTAPKAAEPAANAPAGAAEPAGPGLIESLAKCYAEVTSARATGAGYTTAARALTAVVFLGVSITLSVAAPSVAVPVVAMLLLGGIAWSARG